MGQDITEFETKRLVSVLNNNLLIPFRLMNFPWLFLFFKWQGILVPLHGNLSFPFLWKGKSYAYLRLVEMSVVDSVLGFPVALLGKWLCYSMS